MARVFPDWNLQDAGKYYNGKKFTGVIRRDYKGEEDQGKKPDKGRGYSRGGTAKGRGRPTRRGGGRGRPAYRPRVDRRDKEYEDYDDWSQGQNYDDWHQKQDGEYNDQEGRKYWTEDHWSRPDKPYRPYEDPYNDPQGEYYEREKEADYYNRRVRRDYSPSYEDNRQRGRRERSPSPEDRRGRRYHSLNR